jgi:hypothetical protein
MNSDKKVIARVTSDLNDFLGNLGGIMGFFGLFGSWVATRFAENNIFRNLVEELFEENPERT